MLENLNTWFVRRAASSPDEHHERLMSGEAWGDFCDRLKQAGEQILRADAPSSPRDRAEGFRYLSRLAAGAIQQVVDFSDSANPRFYRAPGSRRERETLWRHIQSDCDTLRNRTRSQWENEELARPLNNAFFFRYHDYTRLYPLALRASRATGSLRRTIRLYKNAGRTGAIAQLRTALRQRT